MALVHGPENRTKLNTSWNQTTDTYIQSSTSNIISAVHLRMKRCILKLDGTVNYYLDPNDSTKKLDGSNANLSGADGYVMVEIPKFSYNYTLNSGQNFWEIVIGKKSGYTLHPAFIKAGIEVEKRYVSAYHACYFDASAGLYKSGLNLDDITANLDIANDKLASVSGVYPICGITRAEGRTLAANNGVGWHQLDYTLLSAIQMLYLIEYANFNSQAMLGTGNTNNATLLSSSVNQSDSSASMSGTSNSWGNFSTDGSQPSAAARPGTAYMSYRGIENIFGNVWTITDGVNINIGTLGTVYVTNDYRNFVDNTTVGHVLVASNLTSGAETFITRFSNSPPYFIPSSVTGGSSTTFITDATAGVLASQRYILTGGASDAFANRGMFCTAVYPAYTASNRTIGTRLAY